MRSGVFQKVVTGYRSGTAIIVSLCFLCIHKVFRSVPLTIFAFLLSGNLVAQDSVWTLQKCVGYAIENNLSIKQSELDKKLSEINLNSAKMGRYPSLSLSTNSGLNLGRSINPTTNQFENTQFSYAGLSAGSSVLLFGWFQKRYAVQKSDFELQYTNEVYEQLKDDIALNIATAYLRVLLAKEKVDNALFQIDLSQNNKIRIEKLLEAGKSNMLELSQIQTQLAGDSSFYLQAKLSSRQSLLELQTLLNLDYNYTLNIDYQMPEDIYFAEKPDPEHIYLAALAQHHNVNASGYAIRMAEKELQLKKAISMPSVNLFYSTGTNYSSSFYEYLPSGDRQLMNFGKQLNRNLSHSIGVGLGIPVFNNFSSRNSIRSAQINLSKACIEDSEVKQKLRNEIYNACTDYDITLEKFQNASSLYRYAETAYKAASIRYESGFISSFELLTEKNKYLNAQNDMSSLKYELQFKKILIERFQSAYFKGW